jgi:anti-anti-sigma factor
VSSAPTFLRVTGELDGARGDDLADALVSHAAGLPDGAPVVVDCAGLTFIDSSGLRVLVTFQLDSGRALVLHNVALNCRRVFRLAGLEGEFTFADD